jgi:hypothetical protein
MPQAYAKKTKPYEHPMAQVAEMVADDIEQMRIITETEAEIVAWCVSTQPMTVYCCVCVKATLAQQDRWRAIEAGKTWPVACALCGAKG